MGPRRDHIVTPTLNPKRCGERLPDGGPETEWEAGDLAAAQSSAPNPVYRDVDG